MEPKTDSNWQAKYFFEETMFLKGAGGNDRPGEDTIEFGSEALLIRAKTDSELAKRMKGCRRLFPDLATSLAEPKVYPGNRFL